MTLTWKRGRNPYRSSPFGILRLGPFARPNEIVPQERKLRGKLSGGDGEVLAIDGEPIDAHALGDATTQLLDAHGLLRALLLVHAQVRINPRQRAKLAAELRALTAALADPPPLKWRHAAVVSWWLPVPDAALVPLPQADEFGLPAANDVGDRALDIVFDG